MRWALCTPYRIKMAQRFTGECDFRKWQVFRVRVNAPSAGSTSNFDTIRAFTRR